jgi:LacI family transcriptional regulator
MGNVTLRVLARELKLSTATVSKALTNSHEISEKTKQRVLDLARKLNYTPNPYASGLRNKKSKTIAVILPEVADSFFAQVIDGIESVAQEKGYHILIRLTHESFQKEQAILKDLRGGRADGILISVSSETRDSSQIRELQEKGISLVFFDRVCEDIETAKVVTDDFESAYQATEHLLLRGCRRVALLYISPDLSISHQRMEGYKKALADHQLPLQKSDIVACTHDPAANHRILTGLMSRANPPDGVIATVEKLVTGIYLACQELELRIPGQVKVIGFSNLPSAMLLNPSLTTITQPAFEMGKAAVSLLFKELGGKPVSWEPMVIPSVLVVRGSTGETP